MAKDTKEGLLEGQLTSKYGVTDEQLKQAKTQNAKNRAGLLSNLQQAGILTERQAVEIQVECFGTRVLQLKSYPLKAEVIGLLPEDLRNKYQLLPVGLSGNILTVATSSIIQAQLLSPELQKITPNFLNFVLAYPSELRARLQEFSQAQENIDEMLEGRAKELADAPELTEQKLIEDPHGPIAQVINYLIGHAVSGGASDMHFEPMQSTYRVRFRQDGVLRQIKTFDKVFTAPFAAAIKIMASMDIAETRLPQDGTFRQNTAGRIVDFRVATFPTEYGEKIVIRILDSNKGGISIENLLLTDEEKAKLIQMIENPYGLIVCAGPTGSGKSTTLYAILAHLNSPDCNILTIEDPIEYRMAGVAQAQVNVKKGFTFASGLRAMLRLDPNVILVGEMRDLETAAIGVQAALTGHLVLSTVHANSATQTVARFVDLGVEPFTVAAALQGVISQRLVRKICDSCREPYTPKPSELAEAGLAKVASPTLFKGKGCAQCHQSGYKGRLPIMEILVINEDLRPLIQRGASPEDLFRLARQQGLMTIRENALDKAQRGYTTLEEILRVLGVYEPEEVIAQKKAA